MALTKDALVYFSHDVGMRNDTKINALRRKFGNTGYAVWCMVLEVLTESEELAIQTDETSMELMACDFDIEEQELRDILAYMTRIGLLQRDGEILYSQRHRERIEKTVDKAREKSGRAKRTAQARWNKVQAMQVQCTSNADALQTHSIGNAQAMQVQCTSNADALQTHSIGNAQAMQNDAKGEKRREEKRREKEAEASTPAPAQKETQKPSYQWIAEVWNEATKGRLASVKTISNSRREKVESRLQEMRIDKAGREKQADYLRSLFQKAADSDFCCGRNNHGWTLTFDWLFENDRNWLKLYEGNYDNKKPSPKANSQLGAGEYYREDGTRTYGTGAVTIPQDAPPRPSEKYYWNPSTQQWLL